jgi:preprotein translocase subunit SecF
LSAILIVLSLAAISFWGLNLGMDFKGGSLLEIQYNSARPEVAGIEASLKPLALGDVSIRTAGDNGLILRFRSVTDAEHQSISKVLGADGISVVETRFSSIGSVLGAEAGRKSILAIGLVIIAIVLFITFAFRKVSEPVSSWKYGLIAILALAHDVIIPTGAFAILGHFAGYEVDVLFVTAILVVLGFSIHDTIVVFDRVRENLKVAKSLNRRVGFSTLVGESISQTFVRSINTSLTTIIALTVLYILGGEVTRHFALTLIIGITAGTYSSIFLASPLLVTIERWQQRNRK